MADKILKAEKYMDDAFSCMISNLRNGIERRQKNMYLWGPPNMSKTDIHCIPSETVKDEFHEEKSLMETEPSISKRKKIAVTQKSKKISLVLERFDMPLKSSKVKDDSCENSDADHEDKSMPMISCRDESSKEQKLSAFEQTTEKSVPKQIKEKVPNIGLSASLTSLDNLNTISPVGFNIHKSVCEGSLQKVPYPKATTYSVCEASAEDCNFTKEKENIDDVNATVLEKAPVNKMTPREQKCEKLGHMDQEAEPVLESKNNLLHSRSKFEEWCKTRWQGTLSKASMPKSDNHSPSALKKTDNKSDQSSKHYSMKNLNAIQQNETKKKTPKHANDSAAVDLRKVKSSVKDKGSSVSENTRLCVKVTDGRTGKSTELMSDFSELSKVKRMYPKVSAAIPDIDSDSKKLDFSAEAVIIILRFIFSCPINFMTALSTPATAIEVFAAAKMWDVSKFLRFQSEFLEKVLNAENASVVFALASLFDLEEICDYCKSKFSLKVASNYSKKPKSCFVSVSTYIEPSFICFPFSPTKTHLTKSFHRRISNTFTFKAISRRYILIGFQVQLHEEYSNEMGSSQKRLEIDYSVNNLSKNKAVCGVIENRPMRPINVINLKKSMILNPGEVGEITIEADIEPFRCSEHEGDAIKHPGKFILTMESNLKSDSPDLKLFIVTKLLYHVQNVN